MATRGDAASEPQVRLSRERVLAAAAAIADQSGLEALTMRSLAEALGVEAMSLYHHVANKGAVLDGLVEVVMGEIEAAVQEAGAPDAEKDWKQAMRWRALRARQVLLRHRWAPTLLETRSGASVAVARYFDGALGVMRRGGFSYDLGHRALHALGSRAMGFTQELFEPAGGDSTDEALEAMAAEVPYLVEMVADVTHGAADSSLGWCDYQAEFEFGLDLILDGLDRLHRQS